MVPPGGSPDGQNPQYLDETASQDNLARHEQELLAQQA